jgi:hypothetical protein
MKKASKKRTKVKAKTLTETAKNSVQNPTTENHAASAFAWRTKLSLPLLVIATGLIYFFSNPRPQSHYDYTYRLAGALLHGKVGLRPAPLSWLNELIPFDGLYYSAFPLGSVLTLVPAALLKEARIIDTFPAAFVVALLAATVSLVLFLLACHYEVSTQRRWVLVLFVMFGTWMWCNLAFAGSWQIALGFAVLGELGALYFVLVKPKPLVAGFCFALAFGNRTEILLVAPIFMYLIVRNDIRRSINLKQYWPTLLKFCAFPFLLGVSTLAYNYVRFHSPFDFGYARIPGVLKEPWYQHGIFSVYSISLNMRAMLYEPWRILKQYPYLVPTGFGGSLFLSSPLLITMFRRGSRDSRVKLAAWIAIGILTLILWLHGNPGGWQFSYRYAMILLPWMFLVLLETARSRVSILEWALFGCSIIANAYATYVFLWTNYVQP